MFLKNIDFSSLNTESEEKTGGFCVHYLTFILKNLGFFSAYFKFISVGILQSLKLNL